MINPDRKTVEDLLSKSTVYAIPDYQRDFEWKRDNAVDFWQDLNGEDFFIGTFVFDVSDGKNTSVVDGQQRLTTIFILLAAIRERAKCNQNEKQAQAVQSQIVFHDNRTGEIEGSKLVPSEKIRDVFYETVASDKWDGFSFNFKNKKRQVNKIKPLYDFFATQIKEYNSEQLTSILNKLYEAFAVVIEIEQPEEAFDIFERMNARGVDLNAADLLKNYLFARSEVNVDEVKDRWELVIDRASGNTLRMIKHFYVSKSGYVTKRDLFRNLKFRGDSIGPEKLLNEIELFSRHYSLIVDGTRDLVVDWANDNEIGIFRDEGRAEQLNKSFDAINLFSVAQTYPVFVKVMELLIQIEDSSQRDKAAEKFLEFARAMENFHFINSAISQKQANIVENYYAEVCKEEVSPEQLVEFMQKIVTHLKDSKLAPREDFISNFLTVNYENDFMLTYYINDRLNNFYLDGSNTVAIYNPDKKILKRKHNIEHLVSQSDASYSFSIDEDTTHNIGNLIVLSYHVNSKLNNKHISEKLAALRDETTTLPEIKQLIDEWDDKKWNTLDDVQGNIADRARQMAQQCYDEVFNLKI